MMLEWGYLRAWLGKEMPGICCQCFSFSFLDIQMLCLKLKFVLFDNHSLPCFFGFFCLMR